MAFSDLARRQMRNPMGSLADVADELQALEDLLVVQPAIQDAPVIGIERAMGTLGDLGGAAHGNAIAANGHEAATEAATAPDAAEPRSDSEM